MMEGTRFVASVRRGGRESLLRSFQLKDHAPTATRAVFSDNLLWTAVSAADGEVRTGASEGNAGALRRIEFAARQPPFFFSSALSL
jgi:hypothetical protein